MAARTRLIARTGTPHVEDVDRLASVELWTDAGWLRFSVRPAGTGSAYKVHLSDGSHLVCSADTRWPVAGRHHPSDHKRAATRSARATAELEPGDCIAICPAVALEDQESAVELDSAYAAGLRLGRRAANRHGSELGAAVCGGSAGPGYGPDAMRAFVDGWAAAQRGCLVGPPGVMADLQVALRRVGVEQTLLEKAVRQASLCVDEREAWTPRESATPRGWSRRLQTCHRTVLEVEALGPKSRMYVVAPCETPAAATMLAVGNAVLCFADEAK